MALNFVARPYETKLDVLGCLLTCFGYGPQERTGVLLVSYSDLNSYHTKARALIIFLINISCIVFKTCPLACLSNGLVDNFSLEILTIVGPKKSYFV